jgi:biotin synthase-related radical SAM superfamily protein
LTRFEDVTFDSAGNIVDFGIARDTLVQIVNSGKPFQTTGCPDCNRPFYNEKPSGPVYNYPRELNSQEIQAVKQQLKTYLE